MFRNYSELLERRSAATMARMVDFAVNELRQDPDDFFELFISSGIARLFEQKDPHIITGMSGVELACMVMNMSGLDTGRIQYRYTSGRSREYWAGWALAQYQQIRHTGFDRILRAVHASDIITMCDEYRNSEIRSILDNISWKEALIIPPHMNEDNFIKLSSAIDAAVNIQSEDTRLKAIRNLSGLSQSQLSELSGISVRTIQQYEQRQKDISRAGYEHITKLAAALGCEPSCLID